MNPLAVFLLLAALLSLGSFAVAKDSRSKTSLGKDGLGASSQQRGVMGVKPSAAQKTRQPDKFRDTLKGTERLQGDPKTLSPRQ